MTHAIVRMCVSHYCVDSPLSVSMGSLSSLILLCKSKMLKAHQRTQLEIIRKQLDVISGRYVWTTIGRKIEEPEAVIKKIIYYKLNKK